MPERVTAVELTEEAWDPFGWIPVEDTDPRDGSHRLEFAWADVHVNVIGHTLDEVTVLPGGLRCDVMFRHDTHTQCLMALNCDSVVAVAPAAEDFAGARPTASVRAFVLHPLQAVVLHRGTWHWGPFPFGEEPVRLFNVQGRRYEEDNASVDLAGRGLSVEVVLPG
ncbi:MAG TPA: ureidoglycolate lyase [Acidimicrobiales bacterium]|nr:ureidoglycolate lyase [Acidimicrobiales bacterium]